jgi:flagellar motor switch protein FliM
MSDVRKLDLTGRERKLRSAVIAMGRVAQAFAAAARRSTSFLARYRCRIVPGRVESLSSSGEFAADEGDACVTRLASADGQAFVAMRLQDEAIALILEAALGGDAMRAEAAARTAASRALIDRVASSLAHDLAAAFESVTGTALAPAGDRAMPEAGEMLRVPICFEGLSEGEAIVIGASSPALEALAREQPESSEERALDPNVAHALQDVTLEVAAELGRVTITMGRLLALRPGDTLRLPTATDDPLSLRIGGVHKLAGAPIVSRGQLAIEVRARHEE